VRFPLTDKVSVSDAVVISQAVERVYLLIHTSPIAVNNDVQSGDI
jgi:hypothetical protein